MKFSLGDKIILKRTGEEGIVTEYLTKEMLEVEVNGTRFPVYADEVDHPYLKWFTEKNAKKKKAASVPEQLPVEKQETRQKRLPKGIYLSFLPVFKADDFEDIVQQLKVYLLNEMPVPVRFRYNMRLLKESGFSHEGTLHAFGHLYLHSIDYGDMNDQPRFHWELSDATNTGFKIEEGILRIKPSKLFEHISDVLQKNEPTFSYKLVEDFVEKPKAEKKETFVPVHKPDFVKPSRISSLQDLPRFEIDLHIEQLVDNYKGLSNAEIMDIQLRALDKYLHLALMHRMERVVVIHGVGTGALRDAVHHQLKEMPEVKHYRNQWMANYGFGATEVIFKR